jgi:oxazoline/thiazoline synthase
MAMDNGPSDNMAELSHPQDRSAGVWIRPEYDAIAIGGEGLYLFGQGESLVFPGALYATLQGSLDKGLSREQIADELCAKFEPPFVHYALDSLVARGVIVEGIRPSSSPEAIFWREIGLDSDIVRAALLRARISVTAVGETICQPIISALDAMGMQARVVYGAGDDDLHIVLTDDYLNPLVGKLASENLSARRPCLLALTAGVDLWIGPFFWEGGACWECLATRLQSHRAIEMYVTRRTGHSSGLLRSRSRTPASSILSSGLVALEVAKWVAGHRSARSEITVLNLRSLHTSTHLLRRRPQCVACGDSQLQTRRMTTPIQLDREDAEGAVTDSEIEQLVSPITGVVTTVLPVPITRAPDLHYYIGIFGFEKDAANIEALRNGMLSQAAGVGMSAKEARIGAICEAVERTSGMYQGDEPAFIASYQDLDITATIHPNLCMLYSDMQYASRHESNRQGDVFALVPDPFDESAEMDWTGIWSLTEQRFKLLPSAFLFYNYPQPASGPYCWADSNGCAAGATLTDAIRRGLLELIERDSVAIWWYNRVPRPKICLELFEDRHFDIFMRMYSALHREVWVLDLTSDLGVPTAAAISRYVRGPTEDILVSFAASLDMRTAVRRALLEMNHLLPAVLPENRTIQGDYPYPEKAQRRWWGTATVTSEPYLLPDPKLEPVGPDTYPLVEIGSAREQLADLQSRIECLGHEVLVLDQTRPDIGIPVAKVLAPGLRHFWARLAPGRLYDVPVSLGWLPEPLQEEHMNPTAMFL